MKPQRSGLARILNATRHSRSGVAAAWRSEAAFRQEVLCAAPLLGAVFLLDLDGLSRAVLFASVILVLVVELANTAIEAAIDRIGPGYHALSGRAKDAGSAAVAASILLLAGVWACVLL